MRRVTSPVFFLLSGHTPPLSFPRWAWPPARPGGGDAAPSPRCLKGPAEVTLSGRRSPRLNSCCCSAGGGGGAWLLQNPHAPGSGEVKAKHNREPGFRGSPAKPGPKTCSSWGMSGTQLPGAAGTERGLRHMYPFRGVKRSPSLWSPSPGHTPPRFLAFPGNLQINASLRIPTAVLMGGAQRAPRSRAEYDFKSSSESRPPP